MAAWAAWREAALAARVADAKQRLATLQLGMDDTLQPVATVSDYAPGVGPHASQRRFARTGRRSTTGCRATRTCWPWARADLDPAVLRLAANAAFRETQREGGVGEEAVQRLDGVLQAYAAVLKAAPADRDAAYNYEFVARVRDKVARMPVPAKPAKGAAPKPDPLPQQVLTLRPGDLPSGPTVHGRPGAPPADAKTESFDILAPMEYGDREAQPEATPGGKLPRKG